MIPTVDVLKRYISHERRDYRRRVAAAARREVLQRTLPTVDTTNVVYHRFILEAGWAITHHITEPMNPWSGEPTAAIHKAIPGLAQAVESQDVDVAGTVVRVEVDEGVRSKVI